MTRICKHSLTRSVITKSFANLNKSTKHYTIIHLGEHKLKYAFNVNTQQTVSETKPQTKLNLIIMAHL